VRLQLVINPAAGGGRAMRALPKVEAALSSHDVLVTPTRSLEHADELVAAAVADDRVVVAMGGDGIVGRVAGAVAPSTV
jgi:diacylglycerol kinase family enzyme